MFGKAKFPIQIWNCRFRLAIFNFEKLDFQNYLTGPGFETASFFCYILTTRIAAYNFNLSTRTKL